MIYELKPIQLLLNFIIFKGERNDSKGGLIAVTDINELQLERHRWSFARNKDPLAVTRNEWQVKDTT